MEIIVHEWWISMLYVLDHDVFCEILVQRPVSRSSTYLPSHMTKEDLKHMQYMAQKHFDKIMQVLKDMPRPIILIIRLVFTLVCFCKFCPILLNAYFVIWREISLALKISQLYVVSPFFMLLDLYSVLSEFAHFNYI